MLRRSMLGSESLRAALATLCMLFAVGCSSGEGDEGPESSCGDDWLAACRAAGCNPGDAAWQGCRINGWTGYVAPPHCQASTGFAGDDAALCAPDPEKGMQLHYGPAGSADIARWVIEPGKESMECLFVRAPSTADLYIGQMIGRSRPGAHHLQLSYATAADDSMPEGEVDRCGNMIQTQFIAIAQTPELDVPDLATPRPPAASDAGGLDFEGSATRIQAGRMFELTVHFLNTGSEPLLKEAWVNLYYRTAAEVARPLEPITMISTGINVPPLSSGVVFRRSCSTATPRTIKYLQGHSHKGMRRFTAWQHAAATNSLTKVYENYDPVEPATLLYSSLSTNPQPNPDLELAGGTSGPLELAAGDSIVWECEFDNPTAQAVIDGGPGQGGQMCYTFGGYVSPDASTNWVCIATTPSGL